VTVYLKLLHGRHDPDQRLNDWGFDGPTLGPFEAVHFTYLTDVTCMPRDPTGDALQLRFHEDLLVYEGKYYGDFEIAANFRADTPTPDPSPDPHGIGGVRDPVAAAG